MTLPWLTRCTGTSSSSALSKTARNAFGLDRWISTRHCPPSKIAAASWADRAGLRRRSHSFRTAASAPSCFPIGSPNSFGVARLRHSTQALDTGAWCERDAEATYVVPGARVGERVDEQTRHRPEAASTAVLRGDAMDAPASIQTPTQHRRCGREALAPSCESETADAAPYAIPPDRTLGGNATHRPGGGR